METYKKKPAYIVRQNVCFIPYQGTEKEAIDYAVKRSLSYRTLLVSSESKKPRPMVYVQAEGITPLDLEKMGMDSINDYYKKIRESSPEKSKPLIQKLSQKQKIDFVTKYLYPDNTLLHTILN